MNRHALWLAAAGIGALAVSGLVGYLTWSGYREAIQVAETSTRNYAAIMETRLDATFRRAEAHLQELARALPVEALDKRAVPTHAPRIDASLDLRRLNFPELGGLRVIDAEGDVIYTSQSATTQRVNVADRSNFLAARDGRDVATTFSEATVSRANGRLAMFIARPVRDDAGRFRGMVSAAVDLEHFRTLFRSLDVGRHGSIGIYRSDNFQSVVRWPTPKGGIGAELPPGNAGRASVEKGEKSATILIEATSDGIARIYSIKSLERYPFFITVGIAREDALTGWRVRSVAVAMACLVLLLLLAGVAYFLWRAEAGLEALNADLEARVAARTAELDEARAAAQEANLAKSRFLANMSHEIRTPMSGVLGISELLLKGELDAPQRRYAQIIRNSGEALLTVINDILDFSKIEAGRLDLELVAVDLRALAAELLQLVDAKAREGGVEVALRVAPQVPGRIRGDPVRLRQILLNLLGNALKFTAKGTVTLSIECAGVQSPQCVLLFAVADTGMGVSAEAQARLFQPFSQADSSMTRKFGGTGLGLAVCKQLVELMGGAIGVDSEHGHGARFWFTIPADVVPDAAPAPLPATQGPAATGDAPPEPLAVLLVEDNEINQEVALAMLASGGHRVELACDGAEAVRKCADRRYDCVLMDCQMPGMDGFEATQRIRASEGACPPARQPIVALTANAMDGDRERCLSAGMDDFLSKPFTAAALLAAVTRNARRSPHADAA